MKRTRKLTWRNRRAAALGASLVGAAWAGAAVAEPLLRDDFDGQMLDTTLWRLPQAGPGSFLGRTQLRVEGAALPTVAMGLATLELDTFNPTGQNGDSFLGTEIMTVQTFERGQGLAFEARVRLVDPIPGGIIGSLFAFGLDPSGVIRDEIDFELMSNEVVAGTHRPFTAMFEDAPFDLAGSAAFVTEPAVTLTQFNTYRVQWLPDRVEWYVNGTLAREAFGAIPDDPMNIRLNIWAPAADFAQAFNAALVPAAEAGANEVFRYEIDYVEVTREVTAPANVLVDPSFENRTQSGNFTGTGAWVRFNNSFFEENNVPPGNFIPTRSGNVAAKAFGPFNGQTDASGFLQNVQAQSGQVWQASVYALTASFDSIAGTTNLATVKIEFWDEAFANKLAEAESTPILDGSDATLEEDVFQRGVIRAVAPQGTGFVRIVLPMIQFEGFPQAGGSVFFDDASLRMLGVQGDMDGNGVLDAFDVAGFELALANRQAFVEANPGIDPDIIGDFDGSGVLDAFDVAGFEAALAGGSAAAPEPGALTMFAAGLLGLLSRRGAATNRSSPRAGVTARHLTHQFTPCHAIKEA